MLVLGVQTVIVANPSVQMLTVAVRTPHLVTVSNLFFKSLCIWILNFGIRTLRPVIDFFNFASLYALEPCIEVFKLQKHSPSPLFFSFEFRMLHPSYIWMFKRLTEFSWFFTQPSFEHWKFIAKLHSNAQYNTLLQANVWTLVSSWI